MLSYVPQAICGSTRTYGHFPFYHGQSGCFHLTAVSHAWPVPAFFSGSSVSKTANQPLQEPCSRAVHHSTLYFDIPADLPVCQTFDSSVSSVWMNMVGDVLILRNYFFFTAVFKKSPKYHLDRLRCGYRQYTHLPSSGNTHFFLKRQFDVLSSLLSWYLIFPDISFRDCGVFLIG